MGEFADLVLEGHLCEGCGVAMEEEAPGHPVLCDDCADERSNDD